MQEKNILVRFLAVPLRQKVVAAGIAVAIGGGVFVLARYGEAKLATTAVLSFDASAVWQGEPGIMHATKPAVALAQSILSDDVITGLATKVGVKGDAAEFRSRLELVQPSTKMLSVNYEDADATISAATANAVANVLVTWMPSPVITPAASTPSLPLPSPQVTSAVVQPHRHPRPALLRTDLLRELEAQLATTDQKLAALNAVQPQESASRKADTAASLSSTQNEQRRALESQLSLAQKKLEALRVRYTDEYPDVETVKEDIADIEQRLASIRPASNAPEQSASPPKVDAREGDMSHLSMERARLTQAIVVEKRHEAMLRDLAASEGDSPVAAPVVSPPLTAQAPVRQSVNTVAGQAPRSPFTLVRLAKHADTIQTESGLLWSGALAGILFGLLYLRGAAWRYGPVESASPMEQQPPDNELNADAAKKDADPFMRTAKDIENPSRDEVQEEIVEEGPENQAEETIREKFWESEVREALSLTALGREEEALAARDHSLAMDRRRVNGLHELLHYGEVSEAIREKIKKDPNSWMAHTEEARIALATGDFETAIREIKLASTVAPESLKPQLNKIIMQLDKNVEISK